MPRSTELAHKTVKVGGLDIFYREAGPKDPRRSCCCTASRPARRCSIPLIADESDCRVGVMAVLLKESASFRERVVSFRSDPDRFLAGLVTFVSPAGPRLPARSGSRPLSRPATQPNSACGS
jgi:hypothetical protein